MDLSHDFDLYTSAAAEREAWRIRMLDVMLASLGVLLFAPVMILIALVIRAESAGPAVFRQERLGKGRAPFTLLKFRSMCTDAEAGGARWAAPNDPRVTRVGKILRRSRLDELPQLINVIRGDMSLVGPRPIRAHFADQIAALEPRYNRRFLVKPGLTGFAQLYAPYGANMDEQLQKIPYDQRYADEGMAVRTYLDLLIRTAWKCTGQMVLR